MDQLRLLKHMTGEVMHYVVTMQLEDRLWIEFQSLGVTTGENYKASGGIRIYQLFEIHRATPVVSQR